MSRPARLFSWTIRFAIVARFVALAQGTHRTRTAALSARRADLNGFVRMTIVRHGGGLLQVAFTLSGHVIWHKGQALAVDLGQRACCPRILLLTRHHAQAFASMALQRLM